MRGPSVLRGVAPHQFGRMTYGRARELMHAGRAVFAAISHGLTSSPPRGEAEACAGQRPPSIPRTDLTPALRRTDALVVPSILRLGRAVADYASISRMRGRCSRPQ